MLFYLKKNEKPPAFKQEEICTGENKMKRLTQEEINKVLENHKHWLAEDCYKWENMKADFSYCDLHSANLHNVDLRYANLCYANLCDADLHKANLRNADLHNANLLKAKNVPYFPMVCPEEGDFIGWKKASDRIIKLHIPEDALRSSSTTRKCRCSKAEVMEIYNLDGTIAEERQVASSRDSSFVYEIGKTVEVKDFDTNRWKECATGIHFFLNRQEATDY